MITEARVAMQQAATREQRQRDPFGLTVEAAADLLLNEENDEAQYEGEE